MSNSYIHPDQAGFLKGRHLRDKLGEIMNIIDYAKNNMEQLLLFFAVVKKAFDHIDWQFMKHVLVRMGFGVNLMWWINLLYFVQTAFLSVEGCILRGLKISRGVRQGCPLSPTLFNSVVEALATRLHSDKDITGLRIVDIEYKI